MQLGMKCLVHEGLPVFFADEDTPLTTTTRSGRKVTKRQSYVLSPPPNATETEAAGDDDDDDGDIASGGMKWKRGSGKRKERKQKLTMEDLEDDDVADEHFRKQISFIGFATYIFSN